MYVINTIPFKYLDLIDLQINHFYYSILMSYPVKNSDIEGQHILFQVTPVQLSKLRVLLAVVFSICSAFVFALALRYSRKFYNAFLFTQCQEESVATHYQIETVQGEQFVCAKKFIDNKPYFLFRMLKYRFNEQSKSYEPIEFDAKEKVISEIVQSRNTLSRDLKNQYFGTCQLKIPIESIFIYSLHAFTGPFNILQYFAVAIWFAEKTVLQPVLILIFTVLTVYLNYFLYVRSRRRLQQLANIHQEVSIKENDQIKVINGADLLPGDLLILKDNQTLNCDCAIIQGDVIVNEATLTGEGIPIPKSALPNQNSLFELEKMSQHCLFEGTKLIQVNNAQQNIAIVLRTGFTSLRGQYFRNVLFPESPSMRFYIQAAKFILEIAFIIAVVYGFLLIEYIPMEFKSSLLVLRFLDNIVWSIPPSMPIFFQICKTASLVRLEAKGVIGNNADKVESAGRIDTCCFDKTGTLTTLGFKAIKAFPEEEKPILDAIMGCCHHLIKINGQLLGDPLEIEMLNFVGWQCNFNNNPLTIDGNGKTYIIHKIFDFSSSKSMMSVIVTDGSKYYLYAKGSPESINSISIKKRDDLIEEFNLNAIKGYRVLGLAYKELQSNQIDQQREQLESQLNFVGLLVMENPLKSDTNEIITTLKESGLDIKVISGDNPLTTIQCGKLAGIINSDNEITFLDYNQQNQEIILQYQQPNSIQELESFIQTQQELALTGKFLEFMTNKGNFLVEPKNSANTVGKSQSKEKIFTEINQIDIDDGSFGQLTISIIKKTKVFARQKPEQKKLIIQIIQSFGRQVLMCGDGANDCSAISQAQVGISFSEADASYTAPFSSKSTSLDCVVKVLLQGKAATMTIIEVFQYQISVNTLKFVAVLFTFLEAETFADFQFTYTSIISNIPLLIFLCLSGPCDTLAKYNPLDDQFAIYNPNLNIQQFQIWGVAGLIVNYFISTAVRDVHTCEIDEPIDNCIPKPIEELKKSGDIQSVMFMSLMFFFMTFAINLYISNPFKQRYYRNYLLLLWTILGFILFFVSAIFPKGGKWAKLINVNDNAFKGYNWIMIAVVVIAALLGFITQAILQKYLPSKKKIEF
ncbi:unnamed protein product (macronuclear) [Paramecium tetraurelia]|uniref:P-type ATPase A domain-containing protein n=1 Tax=Paramecium tetraurelia TaxID=5888 RepID=A0C317_PARTE|nr:uncharacterized protein GSPATT00034662001 [Paramecium tetraurelia]CAK65184.1 unnamed protein product [Paramecium tetraurelia]|eukprot:XP_001432581.1 hypothetical protein (macronuclear) [Paramecium tetraurelia strain d4-2]